MDDNILIYLGPVILVFAIVVYPGLMVGLTDPWPYTQATCESTCEMYGWNYTGVMYSCWCDCEVHNVSVCSGGIQGADYYADFNETREVE